MGSGYGVKDLYEYGGFIVGAIIGTTIARQAGAENRWVVLGIGVLCGMACGFVGHKLHVRSRSRRPDEPSS